MKSDELDACDLIFIDRLEGMLRFLTQRTCEIRPREVRRSSRGDMPPSTAATTRLDRNRCRL